MLGLFKRKVKCKQCGKKHKPHFQFGDYHFCSYPCWEAFGMSMPLDELIALEKYDRRKNGY